MRRKYFYIILSFFILFSFSFVSCTQQTDESLTITSNETVNETENQTVEFVAEEVPQQPELKPASFSVSELTVSPSEVLSGSPVYIQVLITNEGDLEGTFYVRLLIDETLASSRQLTLSGNTSEKARFTINKYTAKSYKVSIEDQTATFVVNPIPPPLPNGYTAVMMGHSLFFPYYSVFDTRAKQAGFVDHNQFTFGSAGPTGLPINLWNNPEMSTEIKNALDTNDVTLFGMIHAVRELDPNRDGFKNWIDYALRSNESINIFIGLPWLPKPGSYDAEEYEAHYGSDHADAHQLIDYLREEYPGINIYCIPYGQASVELKKMWEAGELPDIPTQIGDPNTSLYCDEVGHPGNILLELGTLIWLKAIYGVDLNEYDYGASFSVDLKMIATEIMNSHDHEYDSK